MYSIPFYRGMLKARGFLLVALCVGLSHGICHNGICDTDRCTDDDYCPSCFSCDTTCGTCKTIPNCCMSHQVEKIQCILGTLSKTTKQIFFAKGVPLPPYPLNGKSSCQKTLNGIWGYPPPLTENQCEKRRIFSLAEGGGPPPPPLTESPLSFSGNLFS